MQSLPVQPDRHDFTGAHETLQRYVDADILAGVSAAVLVDRELVDVHCAGWADREAGIALNRDHLFRVFSNTKLVTACALLLLHEQGLFALDDPVEHWLSQLGNRRVLRPHARDLTDCEPARGSITIRQLLCHSSGLSYGLFDPGSILDRAYREAAVHNPSTSLAEMVDALAALPLSFHPGTSWEYSIATDVLARLVEILSGERFDTFIQARIFDPLGMTDTGFVVPESERQRLVAYYAGADANNPMEPGLTRLADAPYPGAYLAPVARLSGGGGLVSTLADMVRLVRSLLPGDKTLLQSETLAMLRQNQLARGITLRFPRTGAIAGKAYGLAGAITVAAADDEPAASRGELQWGGMAGTHWWISHDARIAAVVMTQRQMAFWHPFFNDYKRQVYGALGLA